jgi:nucleoid DNA-binding protein
MNKLELINELMDECQISKKEAATIIDFLKLEKN